MRLLPTYGGFLGQDSFCAGLAGNKTAETIFEFLCRDEVVFDMLDLSDAGRPALDACVAEVERLADEGGAEFSLGQGERRDYHHQAVGRMCKTILEQFGYIQVEQKDRGKQEDGLKGRGTLLNSRYIKTAAVYKFDAEAPAELVVKKIIAKA